MIPGLRKKPKIFVIGFNRCGTTSLHVLFKRNRIPSLHYHVRERDVTLPHLLSTNLSLGQPLLGKINRWTAYSDMGSVTRFSIFEGARLFRQFHAEHPDAYFILNTRPLDKWIQSRLGHLKGQYARNFAACAGVDEAKLPKIWRKQRDAHHADVRSYFAGNESRFLEFDIEADDPAQIRDFLSPDHPIDIAHWGKRNETRPLYADEGAGPPLTAGGEAHINTN